MLIIPAIDLLDGKVVRLREGKREQATIYSDKPADVAKQFIDAGATRLHVVDLDGAFGGQQANQQAIVDILGCGVPVQLGGGLRDFFSCRVAVEAGVRWVVLGSALIKNPLLIEEACSELKDKVIVAVDARDGKVAISGWTEQTGVDAIEAAREAAHEGASAILYTDIHRDGTEEGPNLEATAAMARALVPTPVIASGGIGNLDDLSALAAWDVPMCIVGRALYEKTFTLAEAIEAAK
jgi:phosphoribosylformimino-5-aminoimidazole carboxamide ribotide isomerase